MPDYCRQRQPINIMIVLLAGISLAQEISHPVNYSKIMNNCLIYSQTCSYSAHPLFITIPTDPAAGPNVQNLLTLYNVNASDGYQYKSEDVTQQVKEFAEKNDYNCSCINTETSQPSCTLTEKEPESSLLWLWLLLGALALLAAAWGVKEWLSRRGKSDSKKTWVPNPHASKDMQKQFDDQFVYQHNRATGQSYKYRIIDSTTRSTFNGKTLKEIQIEGGRKIIFQN